METKPLELNMYDIWISWYGAHMYDIWISWYGAHSQKWSEISLSHIYKK